MVRNLIGDTLLVTLDRETDAGALADAGALVAADVHASHPRRVILDLGAVEVVDATDADALVALGRAVRLLGSEVVVAGLRAPVAAALTLLGIGLDEFRCVLDVGQAMGAGR